MVDIYLRFRFAVLQFICKIRGHDYQEAGYSVSPNTGWEAFACRRCGEYHRITYY